MLVFFAHCSLLTDIKYTTKEQEVLDFLYPVGFNTYTIHKTAILAGGQYVAARVSPPLACLIVCFLFLFHYTATNEQGDQDKALRTKIEVSEANILKTSSEILSFQATASRT